MVLPFSHKPIFIQIFPAAAKTLGFCVCPEVEEQLSATPDPDF